MKLTEKKRKSILDAAVDEFRFHGFEGARTTRIAKAANVSSRTMYNHFPTKQSLFDEIVEIIVAKTGAIRSEPYDPKKPVRDQLLNALKDYIDAITDEQYLGLNRMAMSEYLRDRELTERVFARAEMSNNPVRAIIVGAVENHQLKQVDPFYATDLITAGSKAFFFWPKFITGAESKDGASKVMEDTVDMFLWKYGAETES